MITWSGNMLLERSTCPIRNIPDETLFNADENRPGGKIEITFDIKGQPAFSGGRRPGDAIPRGVCIYYTLCEDIVNTPWRKGFRSSTQKRRPATGGGLLLITPYLYGVLVGVDFNVCVVNPGQLGGNARDRHFFVGLTAQVVLRITYCYEIPERVFEAVEKIKINPTGWRRGAEI